MTLKSPSASLIRCLYRSLLKATKPLHSKTSNSVIFNCLFHRTGVEDENWSSFLRKLADNSGTDDDDDEATTINVGGGKNDNQQHQQSITLFRKLLQEVITGDIDGIRQMQFPCHVVDSSNESNQFHRIIRREFRMNTNGKNSISSSFHDNVRLEVAFMALREINKKLAWFDHLQTQVANQKQHPNQAALHVQQLPLRPSSTYLRPGTFLISHPHMTGYFRRSVICILDHKEEDDVDTILLSSRTKSLNRSSSSSYGTYGLIINRTCSSPHSGKHLTLDEILRPIPPKLLTAFGTTLVKEGGPVHMSLQMVLSSHSRLQDDLSLEIGGTFIRPAEVGTVNDDSTSGSLSTYYNGDVFKAADAVASGQLDPNDVSFFVGASCWSVGQLESEIERGFWLPCSGPLEIAQSGICHHHQQSSVMNAATDPADITTTTIGRNNDRPRPDLWLSMLCACGTNEAELAHFFADDDGKNEFGGPCDGLD
jgi:putative AlgH/UPF0301 family transcriptional regulator